MSNAFEIAAAALRAEQTALETHANNVANINTPGFKRLENQFAEVMAATADAASQAQAVSGAGSALPVAGVRVSQSQMLFAQGALRTTGNPLDLAIDGRGFIELMGSRGETLLWRGGRLQVSDTGMLETASGFGLRTAISMPVDAVGLEISDTGVVTARTGDGEDVELGQIGLVMIDNEAAVERLDNGLLRLKDGAQARDAMAAEDGAGRLAQGAIEESNVELTQEMVQMMIVQRAYAANAQMVQAADQFASIANNLKR